MSSSFDHADRKLLGTFCRALLQRLVQELQLPFSVPARCNLPLAGLVEARIIDGDGGLRCQGGHNSLGALGENPRLRMTKKKPAQHFARAGNDRNRKIAANRQMALGHAMVGCAFAVARIAQNVVGADRAATSEGRFEYGRVAGHRKLLEGAARCTRERVERIGFAALLDDIVEEGAEGSVAQLYSRICHQLNEPLEIVLGRHRNASTI